MTLHGKIQRMYARLCFLFSQKCYYFKGCPNADNRSCVCMCGGNAYCGKWREYEGRKGEL